MKRNASRCDCGGCGCGGECCGRVLQGMRLSLLRVGTGSGAGAPALIHRAAEKGVSRNLSFRCEAFSETQSVPLLILGNPICRGNPMRSGPGLCRNARTTFRYTGFSEI